MIRASIIQEKVHLQREKFKLGLLDAKMAHKEEQEAT